MMTYFFSVTALCYFIFFPNLEKFTLDTLSDNLTSSMPNMKPLWQCVRYWPCSLLYLTAEAWGAMALGVLFWTYCNDVISYKDSKRIYSYLGSGAAFGTVLAGIVILKMSDKNMLLGLGIILLCILAVTVIYYFISQDAKANPDLYIVEGAKPKKKKVKMSFMESLKFLASSKHLRYIATLVLCYGAFMSLFEAVAKTQNVKLNEAVKALHISGESILSQIYGYQGVLNGLLSLLITAFFSGAVAKKGWKFVAGITPVIATICTGLFFLFLFGGDLVKTFFTDENGNTDTLKILYCTSGIGILNQVTIKATKYIMFDPTCNQAYIPLDEDSKVRGKAAVDGVGSRLGKSFGSLLISLPGIGIYAIFGNLENGMWAISILIAIILFIWLRTVGKLGNLLKSEGKN